MERPRPPPPRTPVRMPAKQSNTGLIIAIVIIIVIVIIVIIVVVVVATRSPTSTTGTGTANAGSASSTGTSGTTGTTSGTGSTNTLGSIPAILRQKIESKPSVCRPFYYDNPNDPGKMFELVSSIPLCVDDCELAEYVLPKIGAQRNALIPLRNTSTVYDQRYRMSMPFQTMLVSQMAAMDC